MDMILPFPKVWIDLTVGSSNCHGDPGCCGAASFDFAKNKPVKLKDIKFHKFDHPIN
jgi:hypothetical protein